LLALPDAASPQRAAGCRKQAMSNRNQAPAFIRSVARHQHILKVLCQAKKGLHADFFIFSKKSAAFKQFSVPT